MNLMEFREHLAAIKGSSIQSLGQITAFLEKDLPKARSLNMLYGHRTSSDLSGLQDMITREQQKQQQAQKQQQLMQLIPRLAALGAKME